MSKPYLIQGKQVIRGPEVKNIYQGTAPINVDNTTNLISIDGSKYPKLDVANLFVGFRNTFEQVGINVSANFVAAGQSKAVIALNGNDLEIDIKSGDLSLKGKKLKDVATPTLDTDASNKKYVDDGLKLKVDNTLYEEDQQELATELDKKASKEYVDTELGKKVDISSLKDSWFLVSEVNVSWNSKTTATSAGTNFKDIVGEELWNDIVLPANKFYYAFEFSTYSTSQGTGMGIVLHGTNLLDGGNQRVTICSQNSVRFFRFDNPTQDDRAIDLNLMINNLGEPRFYVRYGTALNPNFSVSKVRVFKLMKGA